MIDQITSNQMEQDKKQQKYIYYLVLFLVLIGMAAMITMATHVKISVNYA